MVPISHDGYVIGDGILFYLAENELVFVVAALLQSTGLSSTAKQPVSTCEYIHDDRSSSAPYGKAVSRHHYRYQIQGPNAKQIIDKLNGGPIAECEVLQHGLHQHAGPQSALFAPRHGQRTWPEI